MQVLDKSRWLNFQHLFPRNPILDFATSWGSFMEGELEKGRDFNEVANAVFLQEGFEKVRFAFGYVGFILSTFWLHGRRFEMWYKENQTNE